MGDLYTRFMNGFNLPVTYGGSGVRLKHGISGQACLANVAQVGNKMNAYIFSTFRVYSLCTNVSIKKIKKKKQKKICFNVA